MSLICVECGKRQYYKDMGQCPTCKQWYCDECYDMMSEKGRKKIVECIVCKNRRRPPQLTKPVQQQKRKKRRKRKTINRSGLRRKQKGGKPLKDCLERLKRSC